MEPDELARVEIRRGDVTDPVDVAGAVGDDVTHVIHLAALQVPACRDAPSRGAAVNVVGTVHVFEAARRAGLRTPLVYASSVAAYDDVDAGASAGPESPTGQPGTHYGVYKRANEGTAHVFFASDGVRSIGLRPYVVYGVGRDQGLTSSPTAAMAAAAHGEGFHIAYGGRSHLQFVEDVARNFVAAARADHEGAGVYNLQGSVVDMGEVVAAIEAAVPEVAGRVSRADTPLPFPPEVDATAFERAVGRPAQTSLEDGVRRTVERFRALSATGRLVGAGGRHD
jgi:nucleoside-diphosphate-sugar epimerase